MAMFASSNDNKDKELMLDKFKKQRETPNKEKHFHIQKKMVLSGKNGVGKSSLALGMLMHDLKEDEKVCIIDADGSATEIAETLYTNEFYNDQIIIYKPEAKKITKEGAEVIDEEKTVLGITTIASEIKNAIDEGFKIKGVIVDGTSNILRYCEDKMRTDKNMKADSGAPSMNVWKIRNQFFRQFSSAYMILPTFVIFITHEDFAEEFIPKDQLPLSGVKRNLIDDCSLRLTLQKNVDDSNESIINYVATIRKNRSNIFTVGQEVKFMTVNYKENLVENDYESLAKLILQNPLNKVNE